jgi:hypothetical protein
MTSTHLSWLRRLIAAVTLGAPVMGTATVWAQGFGPDPFRPYNGQYEPYVRAIGPASPAAGQSAPMNAIGNRGANQFQNFLNDLQAPANTFDPLGDRFGIGQPYYRSTVDPAFSKRFRPAFLPRERAERSFEETQRLINEKYFAYFEEKDPRRRARLLRDFNQAQARVSRALSARREDPARILQSATGTESEPRSRTSGRSTDPSSPSASPRRTLGSVGSSLGSGSRSLPPAPPLPLGISTGTGTRRTPLDVLDRARRPSNSQSKPAAKRAKDARSSLLPPVPTLSPREDE